MLKIPGQKHELLLSLIRNTGLSQKELADKVGMRASDLSKIINFSRRLQYDEAKTLAEFFNREATEAERPITAGELLEHGFFTTQPLKVYPTKGMVRLDNKPFYERKILTGQENGIFSDEHANTPYRFTITEDTLSALKIFTGDVVFTRPIDQIESDHIIALRFKNDEKILFRKAKVINEETIILYANPTIDPLIVSPTDFDIIGRVVKIERFL